MNNTRRALGAVAAAIAATVLLGSGAMTPEVSVRSWAAGSDQLASDGSRLYLPALLPAELRRAKMEIVASRWGYLSAISLAEDLAVVSTGTNVTVLDVSDPDRPVPVSRLGPFSDITYETKLLPSLLMMCVSNTGLILIDLTRPAGPREIAHIEVPCDGIEYGPDMAYTWDRTHLYIVDISEPASAHLVGASRYRTEGVMEYPPYESVLAGNVLYVRTDVGVYVVDVSDPQAPRDVGKLRPGLRIDSAIGSIGYGPDERADGAWTIVDVRKPLDPAHLGTLDVCPTGTQAREMVVDGQLGYVDCAAIERTVPGGNVWQLVDLSNPARPGPRGSFSYEDVGGGAVQRAKAVDSRLAAVVSGDWVRFIDHRDPTDPRPAGWLDAPVTDATYLANDGRYLYASDNRRHRLWTIDVTDPAEPQPVSFVAMPPDMQGLHVSGSRAYVVGTTRGEDGDLGSYLQVFDLAADGRATRSGEHEMPELSNGICVVQDHAFVAAFTRGLRILRIGADNTVSEVGRVEHADRTDTVTDVSCGGNGVVYGATWAGVTVFDVSDVTNPTIARELPIKHVLYEGGAFVHGGMLFVTTQFDGVLAYDLADPRDPKLRQSLGLGGRLASAGDDLFVANMYGLSRLRVSDLGDVVEVDRLPLHLPRDGSVTAFADHVYMSVGWNSGSGGVIAADAGTR